MTDVIDKIARTICQEQCAYRGEPACWKVLNGEPSEWAWPNPNCDEPGCMALAKAVVEAFMYKPGSDLGPAPALSYPSSK
ncbi:hypothetical protein GA0061099_102150 [Bradyrhizobium yuanmingense]|uniref:Uncharacterized protein n=1 Tax=Bradyrhizobium yuanmingense TaxID=108015 RepID=A0A1C3XHM8_9BRAD|nr:hypothetical protein IQ15_06967 [Bradyrhizobium yuanmingense]SCB51782.1 hypothetical protein GA0061099_102150 [Bradyrhizobium yuanmingense]